VQAILSVASCSKNANQPFFILPTKNPLRPTFLRYFLAKRLAAKGFYLNNPAVLPHKQHGNTA
jgi:hypothetical protein